MAPVIGEPADLINAAISALRGNWGEAGTNALAAIPFVGNAVTAGKWANRISKLKNVDYDKAIDNLKDGVRKAEACGDKEKADFYRKTIELAEARKNSLRNRMGDPPAHMKKAEAHHDLPEAPKFQEHWDRVGLDINDPKYGRWVEGGPVGDHQKWSKEFEKEWDKFFEKNPEASREEILKHMNDLQADPRFQ
jgi:hypothetical protein